MTEARFISSIEVAPRNWPNTASNTPTSTSESAIPASGTFRGIYEFATKVGQFKSISVHTQTGSVTG